MLWSVLSGGACGEGIGLVNPVEADVRPYGCVLEASRRIRTSSPPVATEQLRRLNSGLFGSSDECAECGYERIIDICSQLRISRRGLENRPSVVVFLISTLSEPVPKKLWVATSMCCYT
jgi:hypothetical protein